jgi:hypothetical protein
MQLSLEETKTGISLRTLLFRNPVPILGSSSGKDQHDDEVFVYAGIRFLRGKHKLDGGGEDVIRSGRNFSSTGGERLNKACAAEIITVADVSRCIFGCLCGGDSLLNG